MVYGDYSARCPDCNHYRDTPNHHYTCEQIEKEPKMPTRKSTEARAELIAYIGEVVVPKIGGQFAEVAVFHLIGRKLAPTVFTSYWRTYFLTGLVRGLVRQPAPLTDAEKERLTSLTKKFQEERDNQ